MVCLPAKEWLGLRVLSAFGLKLSWLLRSFWTSNSIEKTLHLVRWMPPQFALLGLKNVVVLRRYAVFEIQITLMRYWYVEAGLQFLGTNFPIPTFETSLRNNKKPMLNFFFSRVETTMFRNVDSVNMQKNIEIKWLKTVFKLMPKNFRNDAHAEINDNAEKINPANWLNLIMICIFT